jgi:HSP20 family protein
MYWPTTNLYSQFSNLGRLFDELNQGLQSESQRRVSSNAYPKINLWSNRDGLIVTSELPGVEPSELHLNVHNSKLTIAGEILSRVKAENEAYQRSERFSGKFSREINLPYRINADKVAAEYKNGILKINLARAEEDKPKSITVKA